MWLWFVFVDVGLARAPSCPEQPRQMVESSCQEVLDAYDMADAVALDEAEANLGLGLGCLREPLPVELVVEVHRARALIAFGNGAAAEVRRSWAAVQALDPEFRPNPARWPASHPMWATWRAAEKATTEVRRLRRVPPGVWVIDGKESTVAPVDRAFLAQATSRPRDEVLPVLDSDYCISFADLPSRPYIKLDPELRPERRKRVRKIGTIVSASLMVGAAGSMGLALIDRQAVLNDPSYDQIDEKAVRANTAANVAVGLAAGSVTIGLATWTIKW